MPKLLALVAALMLFGCAGRFDVAKATSPQFRSTPEVCQKLDDRRILFGGVAKGSAALAGASGLAIIPATSHEAEVGLAAGSVAAGAVAAGSFYLAEEYGESWVRQCQ